MESVLTLMDLDMPVPDHTTLSQQGQGLEVTNAESFASSALDIVVDSTGPKIFGPGEWLAKQHSGSKHREWRKLRVRTLPTQRTEVAIAVQVLDRMAELGMPVTERIA